MTGERGHYTIGDGSQWLVTANDRALSLPPLRGRCRRKAADEGKKTDTEYPPLVVGALCAADSFPAMGKPFGVGTATSAFPLATIRTSGSFQPSPAAHAGIKAAVDEGLLPTFPLEGKGDRRQRRWWMRWKQGRTTTSSVISPDGRNATFPSKGEGSETAATNHQPSPTVGKVPP